MALPCPRPFHSGATPVTAFCFSERLSNLPTLPHGLSKATLAATRPSHLFLRAFKPAVCPASNASNAPAGLSATAFCFSERLSNPSNASAGLSKATLAATRPSHLFLRAFTNASNASAGLSKATLAATRRSHLFLRAFKPAVCPASNASNASAGLSKATLAAARPSHLFLRAFQPAVCPASNASNAPAGLSATAFCFSERLSNPSNASAGLSKATLAATRPSHLFLRAFKPAVCPASNASNAPAGLPQAFPRQLSQLHAPAICF